MSRLQEIRQEMSKRQWLEFCQTAEYLVLKAEDEDPTGVKAMVARLWDKWKIALDIAKSLLIDEAKDLNISPSKAAIEAQAEELFKQQGFAPPHWVYVAECESCGFIPVKNPTKEKLESCPWCDTIIGERRRELYATH